jgi:hypothetical protein
MTKVNGKDPCVHSSQDSSTYPYNKLACSALCKASADVNKRTHLFRVMVLPSSGPYCLLSFQPIDWLSKKQAWVFQNIPDLCCLIFHYTLYP